VYGALGLALLGAGALVVRKRQHAAKSAQRDEDNDWAHARGDREEQKSSDEPSFVDFMGGDDGGASLGGGDASVSSKGAGFFALSPFSSCAGGGHAKEEKGGRGFRGNVAADPGAFLGADPASGMMDSDYTASPLVDPRFGSF
jgi:hypothetical protein